MTQATERSSLGSQWLCRKAILFLYQHFGTEYSPSYYYLITISLYPPEDAAMQAMTKAKFRCTNFAHRYRKQKGEVAKSFHHLVFAAALTTPASCTAEPVITLVGKLE